MASSRAEGENGGSSPNTSSSIIGQNSSQSFRTGTASSETGPSTPRFPASVNMITSGQLVCIQRYLRHPGLDLPADVINYRNADLAIALGACDDNLDPKDPDVYVPEAQMPRHVSGHVEGKTKVMPEQIRELVEIYVAARERHLGDQTETKGDHSQRRLIENVDKWIAMTKNRGAFSDELTFPAKTRWAIASDPLHSRWKESTKRQLVEESREEDREWKAQKETEVKERELEEKRQKLEREQREWKQKQKEFQEIKEQLQKSRRAQGEWEEKEREQKEKQQKIEKARKEREQKAKLDKSERARKKREQKEKDREQMLQKERIKQEREHKEREQREIEQKEKRQKETEQNESEQNEREQEERARKQRELNEDIAKEQTEREWKKRKRDSNGQAPGVAMRPENRSSNAPEDAEGVRRSRQPQIRPRNANREHRRR
ncbi:Reticulocyte-binding protein 2-like protein a [Colletotrichum fructicola]|nr:Reticulocyte-binding protein 2-like protein a [Colletotrichum fructicola]